MMCPIYIYKLVANKIEPLSVKVGVQQTKRAVNDGKAARVFLAEDADPRVTAPVEALCAEKQIPVERVPQMKELGSACGIAVPSAVAALLH